MGRVSQVFVFLLFLLPLQLFATEKDYRLHIFVDYLQNDNWKVTYQLPIGVNHVAFQRRSNFDRRKLYKIDETKFKWDKQGEVLLIRSVDGSEFNHISLTFSSFHDHILKDYNHNLKYTDGSVLLYTNHLALGPNVIKDKAISPIEASFKGTQFHFSAPKQKIIFDGQVFVETAQWASAGQGTYVYFGDISPIHTDNLIAIVDPNLPKWVKQSMYELLPKLMNYYQQNTGQSLDFKPIVFFNYGDVDDENSNYEGGVLGNVVQLTLNGRRWQDENQDQFNKLFQFVAHEAAHLWNGTAFNYQGNEHSWMHEGGADAFANFALADFGLINHKQMLQRFEEAANSCGSTKNHQALSESIKLKKYRNFYTCGAVMALASHYAIKAKDPNKSLFDLWKNIFSKNQQNKTYNQADYFEQLNELSGSTKLSTALGEFSDSEVTNNQDAISSWFKETNLTVVASDNYPKSIARQWGERLIRELMKMHCGGPNFTTYEEYAVAHPTKGCKPLNREIEVKYLNDLHIFQNGGEAYQVLIHRCADNGVMTLSDRNKSIKIDIQCVRDVPALLPYLSFKTAN